MFVLRNPIPANIVAVLTQLVEIVGCCFRAFLIQAPEFPHDLRRPRRDAAHEPRVKQVALRNGVRDHALFRRIVALNIQAFWELVVFLLLFEALEFQFRKQAVPRKCLIKRV